MALEKENRFKKSIDKASENTKENITSNIESNINTNILDNAKDNILDSILQNKKKDRGKSCTFYLSADVGDALNKLANKSSMSKSELVDNILRKVLIS